MIKKTIFATAFLASVSTNALGRDYITVDNQQDQAVQTSTNQEEDRKVWKARFILSMTNDPDGYDALTGIYQEPTQRRREMYINSELERQRAREAARRTRTQYLETASEIETPLPGPGFRATYAEISKLQSAEDELYKINRHEQKRKLLLSQEIARNPEELERVAERYSQLEYSTRPLTNAEQAEMAMLDHIRKNRFDLPQGPMNREELIRTTSMPSDVLALLESNDPNPEKFTQYIENNSTFKFSYTQTNNVVVNKVIEGTKVLLDSDDVDDERKQALEAYKMVLEEQKRLRDLQDHKNTVSTLKDTEFLLRETGQLLFPNDPGAQKAVKVFSAGTKLYDALGGMAISGITTGGVGLFVSGLNMLSTLGNSGPTADEKILEMLGEIQDSLQELRQTQLSQSVQLDELIESVMALEEGNQARFEELREVILKNSERLNQTLRASFTDLSIDLTTRPLDGIIGAILPNHPVHTGRLRSEYLECLQITASCTDDAMKRIGEIVEHVYQIYNLVSEDLPLKPFLSDKRGIGDFISKAEIDHFTLQTDVDDRLGVMLESMFEWLEAQYNLQLSATTELDQSIEPGTLGQDVATHGKHYAATAHRDKNGDIILPVFSSDNISSDKIAKIVSPSLITRRLIPEYKRAVEFLPLEEGLHGQTGHVQNMQSVVDNIEALSKKMRSQSPLAVAIFFSKFEKIIGEVESLQERYSFPQIGDVSADFFNGPSLSLEKIAVLYEDHISYIPQPNAMDHAVFSRQPGTNYAVWLAQKDYDYHEFLSRIGVTRFVMNSSGFAHYELTPVAQSIFEKKISLGEIGSASLDSQKIAPHYITLPNLSVNTNDVHNLPLQTVEEKRVLMHLALAFIEQKRSQNVLSLLGELRGEAFQKVLLDAGVAKLTLDTLVQGGYGECAFTDGSSAPYSLNILRFSDIMYGILGRVDSFKAEDGYLGFMEISKLEDHVASEFNYYFLSSMAQLEYSGNDRECSLGLGNTVLANQMLEDVRLLDPNYKIPTFEN
ncbi:hypothetical protein [Sulfitobacter geojensis]|uniref:hypothetical protein n=1 Tax=Sulfitobacter geojensis TaxID=1342299 RepID=UPI000468D418|nr:hypothetical protein [Sulfitobacter geojensis]KHA51921.1 hypothetical protein Z947_2215 [Sulfitobacter geojensis]NYI29328.1 hypothetical protein [Sulfitobacter geojensis]